MSDPQPQPAATERECRTCGHWRRNHGLDGCHVVMGTVDALGDTPCDCPRWVPVWPMSSEARGVLMTVLRDIAGKLTDDVKFERGEWVTTASLDPGGRFQRRQRGFVEGVTICRGVIADELREIADWYDQ